MILPIFTALPLLTDCADHKPAVRSRIDAFEQRALASGAPLVDLPVIHRFTPGLYVREVTLREGVIYTSRVHLTQHPFVISKGCVTVFHEDGSQRTLRAPHTGITQAGTRRAILVHEECVWTTFHPTTKTDLEEIEKETVADWPEHLRLAHSMQPAIQPPNEQPTLTP